MNKFDFTSLSGTWKFRACMAVAVLAVLCQLYYCFSYSIWYDESYSLQIIRFGYTQVVYITSIDVHPPLYYLILKLFVDGVHLLLPNVQAIFLGKMVSVIPFIILIAVCATKVRRQWGNYVAGVGAVCLACLRIEYGVEIRMYSFGLLFVTLTFLWLWDVLSRWDVRAWSGFVIFSLCAAYTHYFALLAVSGLWLALLIYVCVNSRSHLKAWGIAAAITIVGYLPWVPAIVARYVKVSNKGFWIEPLTLESFCNLVGFVINDNICQIVSLILMSLMLTNHKKSTLQAEGASFYALAGMLLPFYVLLVGVIVSLCFQPCLITRYLVPVVGCLWLGQLLAARAASHNFRQLVACMLLVISVGAVVAFIRSEGTILKESNRTMQLLSSDEDGVYIADATSSSLSDGITTLGTMTDKPCFVWKKLFGADLYAPTTIIENLDAVRSIDDIIYLLSSGKHVYYISDRDMQEEEIIQSGQFAYKDLGLYKLGLYSANIYSITLADKDD